MAAGDCATNYLYGDGRKMLVELQYASDTKKIRELKVKIRKAFGYGSAILVCGWKLQPSLDFTEDHIGLYRPTLMQYIEVQGMY